VGSSFIESIARPGGNITGLSNFDITIGGKWLELLKEIAPTVRRSLILVHPAITPDLDYLRAAEIAAPSMCGPYALTMDKSTIERCFSAKFYVE